ncbi:hypothetical protein V8G61_09575 [Gaetbulibacter sp. M240]
MKNQKKETPPLTPAMRSFLALKILRHMKVNPEFAKKVRAMKKED